MSNNQNNSKKRTDYQLALKPHRKKSKMEIIGELIIWVSPVILIAFIIGGKWDELVQTKTSIKIELASMIILFFLVIFYIKWGHKKLRDKMIKNDINEEKNSPILVICNTLLVLAPFGVLIFLIDFLTSLNEPISSFLLTLLIIEAIGRILLIIDSFKEVEYKDE